MNAKDLRLGNLIFTHGRVSKVMDLVEVVNKFNIVDERRSMAVNLIRTTACYLSPKPENIVINESTTKVFTPIPLTEEWLVKFKFKLNGGFYKILSNDDLQVFSLTIDLRTEPINVFYRNSYKTAADDIVKINTKCNHVHQLQNLYHALTGEELTINK